jgi:hypothetical protein
MCTGVQHTSHRPRSCTSVVMRAVQLCASTRLGCTPVWKVSSHLYSCTDQVIQFVRVYTPYTLKGPPYSHHEPRRRRACSTHACSHATNVSYFLNTVPRLILAAVNNKCYAPISEKYNQPSSLSFKVIIIPSLCIECIRRVYTRVQTVPLDPYSCTGEMTPSIQVYSTPHTSRRAQLYSSHHYRCTAVSACTGATTRCS